MMENLENEIGGQLGVQTRIRCFAHILNLVVKVCNLPGKCVVCITNHFIQAMLVPFSREVKTADDEDDNEDLDDEDDNDNEVEEGREVFDDAAVEDAMKEVNDEFDVSDAQAKVARLSLTKVSFLCSYPIPF